MRCLAAASATIRPTVVEPVKKMWSHRSASSAVVSSTPPSTTITRLGVDVLREQAGQRGRARRGQLGGLGEHAVAGRQRRRRAARRAAGSGSSTARSPGRRRAARARSSPWPARRWPACAPRGLHPRAHVLGQVPELLLGVPDVGGEGLHLRTAEVAPQRLDELGLALVHHPPQPGELRLPPRERAGAAAVEGGPQRLGDGPRRPGREG